MHARIVFIFIFYNIYVKGGRNRLVMCPAVTETVRNRRNQTASAGFIFTHVGQVENDVPYVLAPNKGKKN